MAKSKGSEFKPGRPSQLANGGTVEGVPLRKAIAMGGNPTVEAKGKGVVQNSKGSFQRKK